MARVRELCRCLKNDLVVSIDADSIMEPDALLKLVKPFLEAKDKKVIGAGGVAGFLVLGSESDARNHQWNVAKPSLSSWSRILAALARVRR